jgi:hypothetical protein
MKSTNRNTRLKKQEPNLFLAQTTLKNIRKIISGYYSLQGPIDLNTISQKSFPELKLERARMFVAITHSFLLGIDVLQGGEINKSLTQKGNHLGEAIKYPLSAKVNEKQCWQTIIKENQICVDIVNSVHHQGEVTRNEFQKIIYNKAGYREHARDVSIGANALIDILCITEYIQRVDSSKATRPDNIFSAVNKIKFIHKNTLNEETDKVFISREKIKELQGIENPNFDLSKLIQYCIEINDNFYKGNYYSVIYLCRAVLDHCPPIFGFKTLNSPIAQTSNKKDASIKRTIHHLNETVKHIADYHIHKPISKKEVQISLVELNFSPSMDTLIGRIIEKLVENNPI